MLWVLAMWEVLLSNSGGKIGLWVAPEREVVMVERGEKDMLNKNRPSSDIN